MADLFSETELLSKQFKAKPTLETYLRIRQRHPDIEFEMAFVGGIDHVFALRRTLEGYGISPELYAHALDADEFSIRKLALIIINDMHQEEILKASGSSHVASRHKVMPQHLRDWLTCCMLGAINASDDGFVPTDLMALLHFRLMPGASRIEEFVDIREKKIRAGFIAGSLKAQGKEPSFRKVAKIMGVQPSTVKRWFASEAEFQAEGSRLVAIFEPDGSLKDIMKSLGPLHKE